MHKNVFPVMVALATLAPDTATSHPDATLAAIVEGTGLSEDETRAALHEAYTQGFCARCPDVQPGFDDDGKPVENFVPDPTIQIHQAGLDWLAKQP